MEMTSSTFHRWQTSDIAGKIERWRTTTLFSPIKEGILKSSHLDAFLPVLASSITLHYSRFLSLLSFATWPAMEFLLERMGPVYSMCQWHFTGETTGIQNMDPIGVFKKDLIPPLCTALLLSHGFFI